MKTAENTIDSYKTNYLKHLLWRNLNRVKYKLSKYKEREIREMQGPQYRKKERF
jgi:hypothetical protein